MSENYFGCSFFEYVVQLSQSRHDANCLSDLGTPVLEPFDSPYISLRDSAVWSLQLNLLCRHRLLGFLVETLAAPVVQFWKSGHLA